MPSVTVKYLGQSHPFELTPKESVEDFKSRLVDVAKLPVENMKLLYKGKALTGEFPPIKAPAVFMLLASASNLASAPIQSAQESQQTDEPLILVSPGLNNLGNTCYLNATIQCLSNIPELTSSLLRVPRPTTPDSRHTLAYTIGNLFVELNSSQNPVTPLLLVTALRASFPQFGEADHHGYKQQDAEECWSQISQVLGEFAPGIDSPTKFIDQYLGGEFTVSLSLKDTPLVIESVSTEPFYKLQVHIGSGTSTYMVSDILSSLDEEIEKNSESLGRSAIYKKSARISRLPAYLVTSFVRFQWKAVQGVKAKILKKVVFPFQLDVSGLCTPSLKLKTDALRESYLVHQKQVVENKKEKIKDDVFDFGEYERGTNPTAIYSLVAVLTHTGRSSDSGHYIAWVKRGDQWVKYDDEKIDFVPEEDIKKLEGGGEWHSAYICLYKSVAL